LFSLCISIPSGNSLHSIISDFEKITVLPNICGAIDGTHIPLSENPNKSITLVATNFSNRKKFNSIILQGVCDSQKIFWNVCVGQPGRVHDGGQFKGSILYKNLRRRDIFKNRWFWFKT